jgi:hypothetical protein
MTAVRCSSLSISQHASNQWLFDLDAVRCPFYTMDSAALGAKVVVGTVRVFDRNPHSRMTLDLTPARLKLLHAFDQCHSSRVFTPLIGWHRKLRRNTEGTCNTRTDGLVV